MNRRNQKNRLSLQILLLFVILVLLSSCTTAPTTTNQPTSTTKGGTTTVATTANKPEDGPLLPFEETVVITTVGTTSPAVGYIEGESVEDNAITRFYKEKLNIDYQRKWVVDSTQAEQKMKLAIAGNDIPDVFVADALTLSQLIEADQIQDVSQVYDQYATVDLKNTLGYADGIGFLPATMPSGEIMGIPLTNDFADNITLMWIRTDWLEALDLNAPKNFDEFITVATAFVEQDPNRTGQDDTWGFAMAQNFLSVGPIDGLAPAFGTHNSIWIEKDGSLVYSNVQPGMKSTLQAFQSMYKSGLIDTEFAVKDVSKVAEDCAQGKIGIYFGQFWMTLWPLQLTRENDPDARWEAYPIPLDINGDLKPQAKSAVFRWVVTRKGFEYPEAVVKSMNLWYEIWRGQYSEWFNELGKTSHASVVQNMHGYALPAFFDPPLKNVLLGRDLRAVLAGTAKEDILSAEGQKYLAHIKEGTATGYAYESIFTGAELILDEVYKEYQYNQFNGRPTAAMTDFQASLNKLELETFTKIIMGQDIGTFDGFVNTWMATGGEQMTKEATEWYQSIFQ